MINMTNGFTVEKIQEIGTTIRYILLVVHQWRIQKFGSWGYGALEGNDQGGRH